MKIFKLPHYGKFILYPLVFVSLILLGFILYIDHLDSEKNTQQLRHDVLNDVAEVKAKLEGNISSNMQLIKGLVISVTLEPAMSEEKFIALSSPLLTNNPQIQHIAIAPNLIIKYMNPKAGNELAIGIDYRDIPDQLIAINKVRVSRKLNMTGPVNLIQGGQGFITRFPVFIQPTANSKSYFWGIISSVINVDVFFEQSGLNPLLKNLNIRILDSTTQHLILGKDEVSMFDPVILTMSSPFSQWTILATPKSGWLVNSNKFIFRIKLFIILLFILFPLFLLSRTFEEIKKNKHNLQAIMDNTSNFIHVKNTQGKYEFVNSEFAKAINIPQKEAIGKTDYDLFPKDLADKLSMQDKEVIRKREKINFKGEILQIDGIHHYLLIKFPLFESNGDIYAVCCVSTDITDQINHQKHLNRVNKMNALATLTSGIAHDYNNMLGIIMGYSELLQLNLSDQPKLLGYANNINDSCARGSNLTKKLLNLTQDKGESNEIVNINNLINKNQDLLEKTLTSRIQLTYELTNDLWPISVDINDLEDVIINISINAMHAIDGSGQLIIRTYNDQLSEEQASIFDVKCGDYVLLTFTDTGEGMTEEVKERIFDPFYSTKGEKGTGLGLSLVFNFMKRSHGIIQVTSKLDCGSCFSLYFPRSPGNIKNKTHIEIPLTIEKNKNSTILVVDDEPALLHATSEILKRQNYHVISVNSANQALEILKTQHIDLLLSDVIMPNMDGYQLSAIVKENYPTVQIQLVSGFTDQKKQLKTDGTIHEQLLLKPINSQILLQRLQKLLNKKI